jgi:hypothetical protein
MEVLTQNKFDFVKLQHEKGFQIWQLFAVRQSIGDKILTWRAYPWEIDNFFCHCSEYGVGLKSADWVEIYAEDSSIGVVIKPNELKSKGEWLKNYAIKALKSNKEFDYSSKSTFFTVAENQIIAL